MNTRLPIGAEAAAPVNARMTTTTGTGTTKATQ